MNAQKLERNLNELKNDTLAAMDRVTKIVSDLSKEGKKDAEELGQSIYKEIGREVTQLKAKINSLSDQVVEGVAMADAHVKRHPYTYMGIAAIAGIILGKKNNK